MKQKINKSFSFDLGHPAHFHLFKNLIKKLISDEHIVKIYARDKEMVVKLNVICGHLMNKYKYEYNDEWIKSYQKNK